MSLLPASMKKIQSKMKALEWTQHYTTIFSDAQGQITLVLVSVSGRNLNSADNSGVGVGIWPKFELIQAFMHVLVTCKNEDD